MLWSLTTGWSLNPTCAANEFICQAYHPATIVAADDERWLFNKPGRSCLNGSYMTDKCVLLEYFQNLEKKKE